jgi:hypothetical protein
MPNEAKAGVADGIVILFTDAQKMRPRKAHLHERIREACADPKLWTSIWPYLTGRAGTDSAVMDHGIVIDRLLAWDKDHGGQISASHMSHKQLWAVMARQVSALFDLENGHVAGLRPLEIEDSQAA